MRLSFGTLSLRYRLLFLAAVGVVPLAIFAAVAVSGLVSERRHEGERATLELSRAIAGAVRGELRSTFAALEGLALSGELEVGDSAGFERLAERAMAQRPYWRALILTDANGQVISRISASGARDRGRPVDLASLQQVLRTGRATIGNVTAGAGGQYAIALRLPVMRDGKLRYVLSVAIRPDGILNVLFAQNVPADWVVAVIDAAGHIVARSRAHEQFLGASPSPSLRAYLESGGEGFQMTRTLEGQRAYTGLARMRDIGWSVAVGIPAAEVEATGYRSMLFYGIGIIVSLGLSGVLALLMARSISKPVARLGTAADALGRGETVTDIACGIPEIDEVGRALTHAAAERKRIEAEKEGLREAEHEALQRAQEASRAKDEFLAMLGHELRNPLAPIVTTLELMRLTSDKQMQPHLQILKRQVSHMTRLVDDLLDVSRIAAGRIQLHMEPVEFNSVLERALEAVAPVDVKRVRRIEAVRFPGQAWVTGDAVRLVQVVTNLLTNALKFTPPEAGITVRVDCIDDQLVLSVIDEGAGIPADLLPRVFDTFTQGHQQLARGHGGLGLGLAIVKSLVQGHGGTVAAFSDGPGTGSRFIVTLPLMGPNTDEQASSVKLQPQRQGV